MFEWNEEKRQSNRDKHGLDFIDVKEIWQGLVVEMPSRQAWHSEERIIAIGMLGDLYMAWP